MINQKQNIILILIATFFLLFIFVFFIKASFNEQINYQGKLTDSNNLAVPNENYNMEFRLYTVETGGTAIWTETRIDTNKVSITNGLFSVLLGEITSLSGIDFNQVLYLGVNIGGTTTPPTWDGEMTPRKKLGAIPAAFEAKKLGGFTWASPGAIGTVTPNTGTFTTLTVSATSNALTLAGAGANINFSGAGLAQIITAANQHLSLMPGGNVGIGTTSPIEKLTISGGNLRFGQAPTTFTTTTAAIDAAVTTIPVASTVDYPSSGTLLLESEAITYTGKDSTNFLGCSRGALGTTPASHATSTEVINYLVTAIANTTNPKLVITGAGNVGIGIAGPPAEKLHVKGDTIIAGHLYEDQPFSYAGKKIEIISPYVTKSNVYKGQLHSHTINGDGVNTPTALMIAYRDAGYDFVVVTDHDYLTPDPGVSGILHIKGVEETATEGHILSINPTSQKTQVVAQDIIDAIISDDAIPSMAHPNFSSINWTDVELEAIDGYFFIEVFNCEVSPNENAENKWDTLLTKYIRAFSIAVDDCHDVAGSCFNKGWVYTFADNLTTGDIVDALKRGNFYSSTGPTLSISVSKRTITATSDSLSTITWIGSGGNTLRSTSNVTSDSYTVAGDEVYVRIKITRNSDSKNAWSNPIYIYQTPTSELSRGGLIRGNAYITGNIGIGTTAPAFTLDLNGTLRVTATSSLANVLPLLNNTYNLGSSTQQWANLYAATTTIGNGTIIIGPNTFTGTATTTLTTNVGSLILSPNGNVGIGTTEPNRKLQVAGVVAATDGGGANPTEWIELWPYDSAIIARNDNPIRIGHADNLGSQGWIEKMRIDPTGNVGIGTTTPVEKLQVVGDIALASRIKFKTADAWGGTYGIIGLDAGTTKDFVLFDYFNNRPMLQVMGDTRNVYMFGNVGIGTTSPIEKLTISGGNLRFGQAPTTFTTTTAAIDAAVTTIPVASTVDYPSSGTLLLESEAITYTGKDSTNFLGCSRGALGTTPASHATSTEVINYLVTALANTTNPKIVITGAGNVGIGTINPDSKLQVVDSGNLDITVESSGGSAAFGIKAGTPDYSWIWKDFNDDKLRFWVNAADRLVIDSAGNVGIGTTTPEYLLDVFGTSRLGSSTSSQVIFRGYIQSNIIPYSDNIYNLGSSSYRWANLYAATTTIGSGTIIIGSNIFEGTATTTLFTTGNSNQLVLGANGNVGIGTTSPAYLLDVWGTIRQRDAINCSLSSDAEGKIICTPSSLIYKEVLEDMSFNKENFLNLSIRTFKWKEEELSKIGISLQGKNIGFIAEEVNQILPELVRYNDHNQPIGIKTDLLPFYLFETIKLQQKEIEEIKLQLNLDSQGIIKATTTTATTEESMPILDNLIEKIKQGLASLGLLIENGIVKVKELISEKILTKEICLEDENDEIICIDKNQLKELLKKDNQISNSDD